MSDFDEDGVGWVPHGEHRWLGRVEDAMNDLIAALNDAGAGMVTAKALGHDNRCIEIFTVALMDDEYVGVWVECALGDVVMARRQAPHTGSREAET